jgi:DNA-binding transcriptional ArsR family regulator
MRPMGDVFRALADPNRRLILDELSERDGQTLFELCTRLINRHGVAISRQAISQHLEVLEDAGLVRSHREGRTRVHQLDVQPIGDAVARWLGPHRTTTPREDQP